MNLENALKALGGDFAKCRVGNLKNQTFSHREDGGLSVCFRYTKEYDGKVWWTSEQPLTMDSCDYLIIALQNLGLLVLPRKVVLNYWETLKVSTLKDGRRKIYVGDKDGKTVLYNGKSQDTIDVSEYLNNGVAVD